MQLVVLALPGRRPLHAVPGGLLVKTRHLALGIQPGAVRSRQRLGALCLPGSYHLPLLLGLGLLPRESGEGPGVSRVPGPGVVAKEIAACLALQLVTWSHGGGRGHALGSEYAGGQLPHLPFSCGLHLRVTGSCQLVAMIIPLYAHASFPMLSRDALCIPHMRNSRDVPVGAIAGKYNVVPARTGLPHLLGLHHRRCRPRRLRPRSWPVLGDLVVVKTRRVHRGGKLSFGGLEGVGIHVARYASISSA
mmetsp:Transcript_68313/g.181968  ORF Transcript_68313/g.181968 Transcript_68313/m.181968 type:complete len:248 (-) Transcript_68313:213-956(-)